MSSTLGLICAFGSAVFNGSFAALFKTAKMSNLNIHPMVFQLYVSMGVFLSSWLVLPLLSKNAEILHDPTVGTSFAFSPFGLIGGCLLVLALSFSFVAVDCIGVALAQGIWGGGAMLVSYLWGVIVFAQVPTRLGLSISGLLLLIVGVACIVFCDKIGRRLASSNNSYQPLLNEGESFHGFPNGTSSQRYIKGVLSACAVGLCGGSILAPLHYVPPTKQGLVFLPSFGLGACLLSPLVFCVYSYFAGERPPLHARQAANTGLLSGLLWNIGNLLSIIAIPAVGYGVAYPIYQCAILVSGAIGIYIFKEIEETTTIRVFWVGGFILLSGGAILAAAQ